MVRTCVYSVCLRAPCKMARWSVSLTVIGDFFYKINNYFILE